MLKIVKLPFLRYKRINLPFEMGMNRTLLILGLLVLCSFAACTKSSLYGQTQVRAQAKIDDTLISQFIRANNLQGLAHHVQMNDTIGVYYIVIDPGIGKSLFTTSTQITVGDSARIIESPTSERLFYSTYTTNDFHPTYSLGSVIRAWQLGVPEINVGGEVRLLVPSRYAYGHIAQDYIGLPANAVLDFDIKLYNVTN